VHDGIKFEQMGKRAVVLCTQPFEVTSANIARIMGIPDYPFALLEHPLGSCTEQALEARVDAAVDAAIGILTSA